MKLTKQEQEICDKYGAYDNNGKVYCFECPLAVDVKYHVCKASATKEEWEEYQDYEGR